MDTPHPTRSRLLEAAVGLFAAQGYDATSVREVCERAGANVAAVNYHFGSKRDLYDAAIDFARAESNGRNSWVSTDTGRDFWQGDPPEQRLRRFIAMMLEHALLSNGDASDLSRLMIHEMIDPTPSFERQVEVSIARVYGALLEICREVAGPAPDDETIMRYALMINAQCHYPALAAQSVSRVFPGLRLDAEGREKLADQIAESVLESLGRAGGPDQGPAR